jgi:hypothetical protein
VQSWDNANKATELSDFSVCTSWGTIGKDLYLLHAAQGHGISGIEARGMRAGRGLQCHVVLIEDKASGTQLIQELVELGLHAVTRYQPQADKIMRMHAQTAMIENGFVHLPRGRMARGIPARADGLPGRQIRRPGRLDRPAPGVAQGSRLRPGGIYQYYKALARDLQTARPEPLSVMAKRLGLLRW